MTALALSASPGAGADEPATPTGVLTVAHRGSRATAPEHTLAAIDQAVADHADRLSIDVLISRDGVPVVIHNPSLARTTNVEEVFPGRSPWLVADFRVDELRRLDAGSWFPGGAYTGSRVLTLDEVLTELGDSPVGLTVEAKDPALHGGAAGIGSAIIRVLDAHPEWHSSVSEANPRLVLESLDWGFLDEMHDAYPDRPLALVGEVNREAMLAHRYVREIDVPHEILTRSLVEAATELGMLVGTWTVNPVPDLQRVVDVGAGAVTTDVPLTLHELLTAQGKAWTGVARPAAAPTARVDLSSPATAPVGGRVAVSAAPVAADGAPLRWQPVDFWARVDGVWRKVSSTATDSRGTAVTSLAVHESAMRVRAVSGGVTSPDQGVAAVIEAVTLPAGAPAPRLVLSAQPSPTTSGADPRITLVSSSIWRAMSGRSWRPGCPVGRSSLRTLRVTYWGFDGSRHRGELVVARQSAGQLARVFTRLYNRRLPIRSLRRLETLGDGFAGTRDRALASGSSFGYACQRMPGDRTTTGSHARGTVVTLNPWENPTRVGTSGTPNSWWLSRSRTARYVHRTASSVLRAFGAEGFAWNGKYGQYADFRDLT